MQPSLTSSRFFHAGQPYKLCYFEVMEGEEWAPPEGTQLVHVEPIVSVEDDEAAVDGMYLWALVPSTRMVELVEEALHER